MGPRLHSWHVYTSDQGLGLLLPKFSSILSNLWQSHSASHNVIQEKFDHVKEWMEKDIKQHTTHLKCTILGGHPKLYGETTQISCRNNKWAIWTNEPNDTWKKRNCMRYSTKSNIQHKSSCQYFKMAATFPWCWERIKFTSYKSFISPIRALYLLFIYTFNKTL